MSPSLRVSELNARTKIHLMKDVDSISPIPLYPRALYESARYRAGRAARSLAHSLDDVSRDNPGRVSAKLTRRTREILRADKSRAVVGLHRVSCFALACVARASPSSFLPPPLPPIQKAEPSTRGYLRDRLLCRHNPRGAYPGFLCLSLSSLLAPRSLLSFPSLAPVPPSILTHRRDTHTTRARIHVCARVQFV